MTQRSTNLNQLRREQAQRVMPLIGGLLDAWEQMPNDLRSDLDEQCPMLSHLSSVSIMAWKALPEEMP